MATFDIQSGGISYRVEAEDVQQAQAAVNQHEFGQGMVGLFLMIIFGIPKLCARLAGFIFALLFKAGFVGKIIQTVIVAITGMILGGMVILMPLSEGLRGSNVPGAVQGIVAALSVLGTGTILAIWYWLWHYDAVKHMPPNSFSKLLTYCVSICMYGAIVGTIIGFISGWEGAKLATAGFTAPFVIALIFWLSKTKPYARPRPDISGWATAAKTEDPIAQYNLALAYDEGWEIRENKQKAFQWYQKSADNGLAEAQYALGQIYTKKYAAPFGVTPDEDKALALIKKAAAQGNKDAQDELAESREFANQMVAKGNTEQQTLGRDYLAKLG
jgi:hypothetical protein